MGIDFLKTVFIENKSEPAIAWNDELYSYQQLTDKINHWNKILTAKHIHSGDVVSIIGDFSLNSIALFLELIDRACIIVPMLNDVSDKRKLLSNEITSIRYSFTMNSEDEFSFKKEDTQSDNQIFYSDLRKAKVPGLVLFSSGTSGQPKAAVHNFSLLLEKFKTKRSTLSTLNFLLFDHWGGLNTVLHTLSNGGLVLTVNDRTPSRVCKLIEQYEVEVLPTSPSFLNLLLVSGEYKKYDLKSLKIISYETEPMAPVTLQRLNTIFPDTKIHQTYGLIELGVLRSKSKSSNSLWVKVGGEGFQTRVVDGLLEIKSKSAMLGYLNAPSPFTEDGWFITGDAVEVDGDWLKILGRKSELINIGGEKVYPQEVENCLHKAFNVEEATVYKESNKLLGNIVCAKIKLQDPEDAKDAKRRIKKHCIENLEKFKVPVKYTFVDESLSNTRFKKNRA